MSDDDIANGVLDEASQMEFRLQLEINKLREALKDARAVLNVIKTRHADRTVGNGQMSVTWKLASTGLARLDEVLKP